MSKKAGPKKNARKTSSTSRRTVVKHSREKRSKAAADWPIEIFAAHEYGAADSWTWRGWLSQLPDGEYSLDLVKDAFEFDDDTESETHELKSFRVGAELVCFVKDVWFEDHEDVVDEDVWTQIADNVRRFDSTLAAQIETAVKNERQFQACIEHATWQSTAHVEGQPLLTYLSQSECDRLAVESYARRYFDANGEWPRGAHRVRVVFGSVEDGADCEPPNWNSVPSVFDKTVTFSDIKI